MNKVACAGADTSNVWDIADNDTPGGSLQDPKPLFVISEPGIGQPGTNGRWHSVTFTWDGTFLVAGWEPGGDGEAECEAADPDLDKSLFFYDARSGAKPGQWVLPRPQGDDETCVVHNFNVLVRPAVARTRASLRRQVPVRRLLVVLRVQRLHLRKRHHEGSQRPPLQWHRHERLHPSAPPQSTDPGILAGLTGSARYRR